MNRPIGCCLMVLFLMSITGCSATLPNVKNEIPIARSDIVLSPQDNDHTRLVIFNSANVILHPFESKMNIYLNGKGVTQLSICEYVQLLVPRGKHEITLIHHDVFPFSSIHSIELTGPEAFLEIYPTFVSNEAKLLKELPLDFKERYTAKY